MLDDASEIEEYEIQILKAQTYKLKSKILAMQQQKLDEKRNEEKMFAAVSKRTKTVVNTWEDYDKTKLPFYVWREIIDEVYWDKKNVIRPSFFYYKYSLPLVSRHIPNQNVDFLKKMLDSTAVRYSELEIEYNSHNTVFAHEGDIVYWAAWLSALGFIPNVLISKQDVIKFIFQHAEGLDHEIDKILVDQKYKSRLGPHKLSTIKRRVASLSICFDMKKWPNPCRDKDVKFILQELTKKYNTSKPTVKAITKGILNDMLNTCGNKLIDIRDRAILLFAWGSGGRKRSEITEAQMKNLNKLPEGEFTYTIPKGNITQEEKGIMVPLKGTVAKALQDWLTSSNITDGYIFRSVHKGESLGKKLSPIDILRIVRRRLKKAGYNEKEFGAHSLRSGFIAEAGKKNKPISDVMALTTHKSVTAIMRYYNTCSIANNKAANLAD